MQLPDCPMLLKIGWVGNNSCCSRISLLAQEAREEASVLLPVQTTAEPTAGSYHKAVFPFCVIYCLSRAAAVRTGPVGDNPCHSKSSLQATFLGCVNLEWRSSKYLSPLG